MTILDLWLVYMVIGAGFVADDCCECKDFYERTFRTHPLATTIELVLCTIILWLPIQVFYWRNKYYE